MIPIQPQSEIRTIGEDIREFKTSINPDNFSHIVTLLTSNLYSSPLDSFIREAASNAWDSHVEAGKQDFPIMIYTDEKMISVRDYGTGLSPERFKETYLNLGSSTKRESNDYIGCFGIGRFAALAVSDMVTLESYYQGIQYTYVMSKEPNNISIRLVNRCVTDESDGFKVMLAHNMQQQDIRAALKKILTIPSIYIRGQHADLNDLKIVHFKNFCHSPNKIFPTGIIVGNIFYKISPYKFDYLTSGSLMSFYNHGIFPRIEPGQIEVTPNREELIYSDRLSRKIDELVGKVKDEMKNIIGDYRIDCPDICDLVMNMKRLYYDFEKCEFTTKTSEKYWPIDPDLSRMYYKGLPLKNLKYPLSNWTQANFTFKYNMTDRWYKNFSMTFFQLARSVKDGNRQNIAYKDKDLSSNMKAYLMSIYKAPVSFIEYRNYEDFLKAFSLNKDLIQESIDTIRTIMKDIYDFFYGNAIMLSQDKAYRQWLKDRKEKKTMDTESFVVRTNHQTYTWTWRNCVNMVKQKGKILLKDYSDNIDNAKTIAAYMMADLLIIKKEIKKRLMERYPHRFITDENIHLTKTMRIYKIKQLFCEEKSKDLWDKLCTYGYLLPDEVYDNIIPYLTRNIIPGFVYDLPVLPEEIQMKDYICKIVDKYIVPISGFIDSLPESERESKLEFQMIMQYIIKKKIFVPNRTMYKNYCNLPYIKMLRK